MTVHHRWWMGCPDREVTNTGSRAPSVSPGNLEPLIRRWFAQSVRSHTLDQGLGLNSATHVSPGEEEIITQVLFPPGRQQRQSSDGASFLSAAVRPAAVGKDLERSTCPRTTRHVSSDFILKTQASPSSATALKAVGYTEEGKAEGERSKRRVSLPSVLESHHAN